MSSFGRLFRVTTFGESHCTGVGCVVEGVPPRMALAESDIQPQLDRRRPGQSRLTTSRNEPDQVQVQSGVEFGFTLGTPISLFVRNKDFQPQDYSALQDVPRPSHADYTYQVKYGARASSGGGRASARETIGRVAAGAIAEKWLREAFGVSIVAWVSRVGSVDVPRSYETAPASELSRETVDASLVRCPDAAATERIIALIEGAKEREDSLGGIVTCVCRAVPGGLGEPCFDKLEALLAHAMLSIPATKGFEFGSGFDGTRMAGSEHNDAFVAKAGGALGLGTVTNRSGGIQGGISNGEDIVFRVAFKPAATIGIEQSSAAFDGASAKLEGKGRHDPCVLPRAVPIVEAMAALCIADAALLQQARTASASQYAVLGQVRPAGYDGPAMGADAAAAQK